MIWRNIPRTRYIAGLPEQYRNVQAHRIRLSGVFGGPAIDTTVKRSDGMTIYSSQCAMDWPAVDRRKFKRYVRRGFLPTPLATTQSFHP